MFLPPVPPWRPALLFWWSNWGAGLVLLLWLMWSRHLPLLCGCSGYQNGAERQSIAAALQLPRERLFFWMLTPKSL